MSRYFLKIRLRSATGGPLWLPQTTSVHEPLLTSSFATLYFLLRHTGKNGILPPVRVL